MINFVTALACEAKPLIQAFKLKNRLNQAHFPIYANDEFRLIITGIGKLNAAIATTYLASLNVGKNNDVWLNVGIAGHKSADIGSPIIANKITDWGSHKSWYPIFITPITLQSASLISHDQAQIDYKPGVLYDMEASGFYLAASRFNTTEFIHSLKVVSDNEKSPANYMPEKKVKQMISINQEIIEETALQLAHAALKWRLTIQPTDDFARFLKQWHFTVYQQNSLKQYLQRWQTLFRGIPVWSAELLENGNAKHVLRYLEQKIKQSRLPFE